MMNTLQYMSQMIDDFRNYFKPDWTKVTFSIKLMIKRTLQLLKEVSAAYKSASMLLVRMTSSSPAIRITVCSESDKSVVTIRDNAGGIAEDIIDRIFDPYFSTKGPDKGTGIGLYMSKNIIEGNMQGRLTVRNVEGGAEFRIEI